MSNRAPIRRAWVAGVAAASVACDLPFDPKPSKETRMASDTSKREQSFDLKSGTTDAAAVSGYYDDWASTYDETLKSWNYQAPSDAAGRLAPHLKAGDAVLDVGCGTGLFGQEMATHGPFRMVGLDISAESLRLASRARSLRSADRARPPEAPAARRGQFHGRRRLHRRARPTSRMSQTCCATCADASAPGASSPSPSERTAGRTSTSARRLRRSPRKATGP